jgi:hypothetical protein
MKIKRQKFCSLADYMLLAGSPGNGGYVLDKSTEVSSSQLAYRLWGLSRLPFMCILGAFSAFKTPGELR